MSINLYHFFALCPDVHVQQMHGNGLAMDRLGNRFVMGDTTCNFISIPIPTTLKSMVLSTIEYTDLLLYVLTLFNP